MTRVLLLMLGAWACVQAPGQGAAHTTARLPFTYILDGGPGRLSDEDFVGAVALGPPWLQHMQNGSIVHSYWGDHAARDRARLRDAGEHAPAPDYPTMYRERIARSRKLIASMRQAGCKTVVCYICIMTIGGDPEKRTGYWEFYDHWDDLAGFGIGPKPGADPEQWNQRKPDGSPHHFYRKLHPPYRPMFRYSQCLNNPHWQQYIRWVVKMNARAGYDGNFVDNANSHRCHCDRCQALFRAYLSRKYSADEMAALFGDDVKLTDSTATLAGVETWRFWAETVKRFLAMIRQAGAEERGRWYVFPNGLRGRARSAVTSFHDCDLAMDENSVGACGTHPGSVFEHVIAGIGVRRINDNIFCFRHTYAANGRVRAALLTRPGYPRVDRAFMMNPDVAALGLAEAAAFSGGGGFLHRPAVGRYENLAPVRNAFNAFFESHRGLYEGYVPDGQVALACFGEQQFYGHSAHISQANALLHALMQRHLLVDVATERTWSREGLGRYRALVIPGVRYMSDAEQQTALEFAGEGRLIVTHDTGKFDLQMREHKRDLFAAYRMRPRAAELAALLEAEHLAEPVLEAKPENAHLRAAAYADRPDAPARLTLHVVDYAVALGLDAAPARPVTRVAVRLPLPAGRAAAGVTLASPWGDDAALPVRTRRGAAEFVIPSMRIYCVCSVELSG